MLNATPIITRVGRLRVAVPADPFMLVLELPASGDWFAVGAVLRETGARLALPPCFSPDDSILAAADESLNTMAQVDLRA